MQRRDVLKGLAGAAALCALPRAAFAATRAFTTTRVGLMLDGAFVGFLQSAAGGGAHADVILERATGAITRKHIGVPIYDDVVIEIGTNMAKPVYDWIKAAVDLKYPRKSGAIVSLDSSNAVQMSLEFTNALITEIGVPALDASSKSPVYMRLKLTPEFTRMKKGDGSSAGAAAAKTDKAMLGSNFRLTIGGLEKAMSKVAKIEELVIKQKVTTGAIGEKREMTKEPATLELPNLVVTVAEGMAAPLYDWHEDFVIKGNNGQDKEKTGTLELLTPDLASALLTLKFAGLGIFRMESDTAQAGSDAIRRVRASMYCEELHFDGRTRICAWKSLPVRSR